MLKPIPRLLIRTSWAGLSVRLTTLIEEKVENKELQQLAKGFIVIGNDSIDAITDTNPDDAQQMKDVVNKHKATIVNLGLTYSVDVVDEKVKDENVKAMLLEALHLLNTELPKYL